MYIYFYLSKYFKVSNEYKDGVRKFIEDACKLSKNSDYIICPCTKCINHVDQHIVIVEEHLIINGMDPA